MGLDGYPEQSRTVAASFAGDRLDQIGDFLRRSKLTVVLTSRILSVIAMSHLADDR
jgi:hypothetical protein